METLRTEDEFIEDTAFSKGLDYNNLLILQINRVLKARAYVPDDIITYSSTVDGLEALLIPHHDTKYREEKERIYTKIKGADLEKIFIRANRVFDACMILIKRGGLLPADKATVG